MLGLYQGKPTVVRAEKRHSPVSESQLRLKPLKLAPKADDEVLPMPQTEKGSSFELGPELFELLPGGKGGLGSQNGDGIACDLIGKLYRCL